MEKEKKETIPLIISEGKCFIPLESLNDVVSNSLFEIVRQQQEDINKFIRKMAEQQREISILKKR